MNVLRFDEPSNMNRLASLLALVGIVLLVTWAYAPAESTQRSVSSAASAFGADQNAVLAEVNAQVERLRERLTAPPTYPPPARDPFRFGRRTEPVRVMVPVPAPPELVEPPKPVLPRLVAVVEDAADGGLLRKAFLSVNDEVKAYKPGDAAGAFLVRSISADFIELVDPASGATYKIALR
jgi:hypothetical protein